MRNSSLSDIANCKDVLLLRDWSLVIIWMVKAKKNPLKLVRGCLFYEGNLAQYVELAAVNVFNNQMPECKQFYFSIGEWEMAYLYFIANKTWKKEVDGNKCPPFCCSFVTIGNETGLSTIDCSSDIFLFSSLYLTYLFSYSKLCRVCWFCCFTFEVAMLVMSGNIWFRVWWWNPPLDIDLRWDQYLTTKITISKFNGLWNYLLLNLMLVACGHARLRN